MLLEPVDPNERFRSRRRQARRRRAIRRTAALAVVALAAAGTTLGARFLTERDAHVAGAGGRADADDTGGADAAEARAAAVSRRDSRCARDDGARLRPGQDRRVPLADEAWAERARARREGRERRGRVPQAEGGARARGRRSEGLLRPGRGRAEGTRGRRLPHRAHRLLRGPDADPERAALRDQDDLRRRLDDRRRARLGESLRQARLGLQRPARHRSGEGRLRRDPVRLRPLPHRRRPLGRGLPGKDERVEDSRDHELRQVRRRTAQAARRAGLARTCSA